LLEMIVYYLCLEQSRIGRTYFLVYLSYSKVPYYNMYVAVE
jgi:hypothetical protein